MVSHWELGMFTNILDFCLLTGVKVDLENSLLWMQLEMKTHEHKHTWPPVQCWNWHSYNMHIQTHSIFWHVLLICRYTSPWSTEWTAIQTWAQFESFWFEPVCLSELPRNKSEFGGIWIGKGRQMQKKNESSSELCEGPVGKSRLYIIPRAEVSQVFLSPNACYHFCH